MPPRTFDRLRKARSSTTTADRAFRVPAEEYRALTLQVHALLGDVPLHDVSAIDLPGGGPGRTLGELRTLLGDRPASAGGLTRALFAVRNFLGRVFHWDDAVSAEQPSFRARIPPAISDRSRVESGARLGPMEILYELDDESLAEGQNATVHAFLCQVLRPHDHGYRLYWAVYVRRVSWFTPIYMAMIEPFRRFVVYPSLLSAVSRAWARQDSLADAPE